MTEEVEDVEAKSIGHQAEEEDHAHHLRVFDEFVAGFAAGDHFDEGEEGVTAVEGRNRQNVHECEEDAKDAGEHPEALPVPDRGKDAGNADDAAERILGFDLLGRKKKFEVANIIGQCFDGLVDTRRDGLEEGIGDVGVTEEAVRGLILETRSAIMFKITLNYGSDGVMTIADHGILDQHGLSQSPPEGSVL